jgi:hypothetical protein
LSQEAVQTTGRVDTDPQCNALVEWMEAEELDEYRMGDLTVTPEVMPDLPL